MISALCAALQPATGSGRLVRMISSPCGAEVGGRPRLCWRGEQPITRLKAVLKALSDS